VRTTSLRIFLLHSLILSYYWRCDIPLIYRTSMCLMWHPESPCQAQN
jgi:hypothetical protein